MALDPRTGRALWHVNTGEYVGNGPITYELGGHQFVVFASGDTLYAFTLPR